jgi:hypothetical protein
MKNFKLTSFLCTGTEVNSMATIDYILDRGDGYTVFKGLSTNVQGGGLAADSLIRSIIAGGHLIEANKESYWTIFNCIYSLEMILLFRHMIFERTLIGTEICI